jgi:hypothetical protein
MSRSRTVLACIRFTAVNVVRHILAEHHMPGSDVHLKYKNISGRLLRSCLSPHTGSRLQSGATSSVQWFPPAVNGCDCDRGCGHRRALAHPGATPSHPSWDCG